MTETCTSCGKISVISTTIHLFMSHDAKAPTCTDIGWDAYQTCASCDYTSYVEKSALGHARVSHDAQAPTCTNIGWDAYETCSRCDYTTYVEKSALGHARVSHDAKAPTCTDIGWDAYETCSRCDYTTYNELSAQGHSYAVDTTPPTCTADGYTTHTCTRCGDTYKDQITSARLHWYGPWTNNANGTHTATCQRGCGYRKTVYCNSFTFHLLTDRQTATDVSFCAVCGSSSDGTQLRLIASATAAPVTHALPVGDVAVYEGSLSHGDAVLLVAFELGGKVTQPTGQVKITLPATLLDGCTLWLLAEDGTETELAFATQAEKASFVLDFTHSQYPICLIRLVPVA